MTWVLVTVNGFSGFGLACWQSHIFPVDHILKSEALVSVLLEQLLVVVVEHISSVVGVLDVVGLAQTGQLG